MTDRLVYVYPSRLDVSTTNIYHLLPECGTSTTKNNGPGQVLESVARDIFGRRVCQTCEGAIAREAMLEEARSVLPTGILDDLARCLEDVPGVEFRILWVRPGTTSPRILWSSKEEA